MPTKPDAPSLSKGAPAAAPPVVEITDLQVQFAIRSNALARLLGRTSGVVKAVDGVNLTLARGEVLGLVGESGSGKSTLGRSLLGLVRPTSGSIRFHGQEIAGLPESKMRPLRRKLQMVFQDPHASLNPSMTVGRSISDALRIHGLNPGTTQRRAAVVEALERVGLAPASRFIDKYPRELSGGQKQRAVIARAIALGPELLVADEPISMLDMSVRAKILGLLEELKRDLGLTYVYITHDLASARFFCDRVAIMYLGRIVEIGSVEEIFDNPRHPYTKALLQAVPDPDPSRGVARELPRGEIPDAASPPRGCAFHPRCPEAFAPCGWESRDVRMVLEQRWTTVPVEQYETESTLVPDAEQLTATPDTLRAGGSAADLVGVLEDERTVRPEDPLWTGVQGISADGRDVRLELRPRSDPRLLAVPGTSVEVACHRHHDPGTAPPA